MKASVFLRNVSVTPTALTPRTWRSSVSSEAFFPAENSNGTLLGTTTQRQMVCDEVLLLDAGLVAGIQCVQVGALERLRLTRPTCPCGSRFLRNPVFSLRGFFCFPLWFDCPCYGIFTFLLARVLLLQALV